MKAIDFPGSNFLWKGTDDGTVYDLHAHNDGQKSTFCMQLTDEDVARIVQTKQLWVELYCGKLFPPIWMGVNCPLPQHADAFKMIPYKNKDTLNMIEVVHSVDEPAPEWLDMGGQIYDRIYDQFASADASAAGYAIKVGDYFTHIQETEPDVLCICEATGSSDFGKRVSYRYWAILPEQYEPRVKQHSNASNGHTSGDSAPGAGFPHIS